MYDVYLSTCNIVFYTYIIIIFNQRPGNYCYTYGNDLNKKNPHPCPSVLALAK